MMTDRTRSNPPRLLLLLVRVNAMQGWRCLRTIVTQSTLLSAVTLITLAICLGVPSKTSGGEVPNSSEWDKSLPNLQLHDIKVDGEFSGKTFQHAWENMSRYYALRSVLYLPGSYSTSKPFHFRRSKCSVRELYDTLVGAFPDIAWTQDPKSGVTWFHPRSVPYSEILTNQVSVKKELWGLRMYSDIFAPLTKESPHIVQMAPFGMTFFATFDYPVHLEAGSYSLRDLINLCCLSSPSKSFLVFDVPGRTTSVSPYNLMAHDNIGVPAGAFRFWKVMINPQQAGAPTESEIVSALSNSNDKIRWASKWYVESISFKPIYDNLLNAAQTPKEALWTAAELMSMRVWSEDTTDTESIKKINATADENFYASGDSELALLVASEMSRVAKDDRGLAIVTKRKISDSKLSKVKTEVFRTLRASKRVRDFLKERRPDWDNLTLEAVADAERQDKVTLR